MEENIVTENEESVEAFYYAQLNEENVCVCLSSLSGEVSNDNMIRIDGFDSELLGKKYSNGKWVEIYHEDELYEPTESEILRAEILLNQAEIMAKQKEHDEVLAELLLGQQGGI